MLAESEEGGGAVWAAYRIPRDHVTVVANAFVIGFVNTADSLNFLFSSNMHTVALRNGWWDGHGQLHFTRAFSGGEYSSRYYAGRRMWAFYSILASSANVPPTYTSYTQAVGTAYPTSAQPDKKLRASDVLRRVYRDYYEGTPYSLGAGAGAGPFGSPVRFKPGAAEAALGGYRWELGW